MDSVKANLVTDPPYNVSYERRWKTIRATACDGKFYEFLLAAFQNMVAHMAEGSSYIFHTDTEGLNFRRAFQGSRPYLRRVHLGEELPGAGPLQWQHEPMLFGWLPNGKHRWFADRKQTTIWNFDKPKHARPTMKPIPLLAYPSRTALRNGIIWICLAAQARHSSPVNRRIYLPDDGVGPGTPRSSCSDM